MASGRRVNPVYRFDSRPLTILGAERKLFFFAMCVGAGTFNLLGSLPGNSDVLVALLRSAMVHRNRSSDSPLPAYVAQITASIRPFKIQPNSIRRITNA